MKWNRFTEEQIIGILKEHGSIVAQNGISVSDLCRTHGVSDATVYKWNGSCCTIRLQGDVPLPPAGSFDAFDLGHSRTWAAVHD